MTLDEARSWLFLAAEAYTAHPDSAEQQRMLADAASAYAEERKKVMPRTQARESATLTLPFGRQKGYALNEASTENLEFVAKVVRDGLDEPARANFRVKNIALLEAIERELVSR